MKIFLKKISLVNLEYKLLVVVRNGKSALLQPTTASCLTQAAGSSYVTKCFTASCYLLRGRVRNAAVVRHTEASRGMLD